VAGRFSLTECTHVVLFVECPDDREDRLAVEHRYAYDNAPSQMNTP
jgi:hypothetical protein